MKKVGIITFNHTTNYGAVLQAYALSDFLSKSGLLVDIIDYRPIKTEKSYWSISCLFRPNGWNKFRKQRNFISFFKHLPLSPNIYRSFEELKSIENYDYLISGSDQVWNTSSWRGYDPSFFLDFTQKSSTKKISYAACVGSTKTFGNKKNEIQKSLEKFSLITVRDKHSVNVISSECGIKPQLVVDPVFLSDFTFPEEIIIPNSKYILVYPSQQNIAITLMVVEKVKNYLNLKPIIIGTRIKGYDSFPSVGPQDYLTLIKKSSFIVTSTFHGTAFSIKYKIPFLNVSVDKNQERIDDLLERTGNIFRKVSNEEYEINNTIIDPVNISNSFDKEIDVSKKLLKSELLS